MINIGDWESVDWSWESIDKILVWLVGFYGISTFCRLFNAKSIFIKIVLFQTVQFRISTQFKCKYSVIVKNISILSYSV